MPLEFDELKRRQQQSLRAARPAILTGSLPEGKPEDLGFLATAGDIIAAPLRGLEGAVQDITGLADTLLFDALPDYEDRVFGESRTRVGGLIEGVSNFAAGFVGAGFVPLGWTGKLGRLSKVARAATRGAIADFATFDGNEERLSNLVQSFPSLANPINGFLAADDDDPELVGRFKNALEGTGIGLLTDGLIHSLRALKAGRVARAAGKSADEVEAAMDAVAPPEAIEASLRPSAALPPDAPAGVLESPARPEAAAAQRPPAPAPEVPPAVAAMAPEEQALALLRTVTIDENQARELFVEAKRRANPLAGDVTIQQATLDPRVNPRKLTQQERFIQGMQVTDLNLSAYRGPDGGLQLVRAMEQILEPLKGLGDASRRTLNQQEQGIMAEVSEMFGENNPHRMMVQMQRDVQDLPAMMRRIGAYKIAAHAWGQDTYKLAQKAFGVDGTDKDIMEAIGGLRTMAEMKLGFKTLAGEVARGLGQNRIPTRYFTELFDRNAIDEALHEVGGRKRALDVLEKFKILWDSSDDATQRSARAFDLAEGFSGRRAMGILNEYWYNSLLGRPTTIVVNAMSNTLTSVYRPLELIAGGALTGRSEIVSDGFREITSLVDSARESWTAMRAAMKGGGQLLDPKAMFSDVHNLNRDAITAGAFGVKDDTVHGQAINWAGKLVRYPSKVLTATDQFFQQLNYRAVARAQLMKEALRNPTIGRENAAAFVHAEMDKLIHRGQAYGTAQLYTRGVEAAAATGLRSKVAVDEFAREHVRKALESPEHARLSALANIAQQRAQEATFTAPLKPGTLSYRYQEMVLNHWYLRLVTPFVRAPVNIIGFAADRSVRGLAGTAHYLAGKRFPGAAASLESSKNILVRDMLSGDPRRKADAVGRMALGMSSTAMVFGLAAQSAPDGMPLITGKGPSDRETRKLLEEAGWQPYSVRVGDRYIAYGRMDPFASILGTAADIVNYIKFAAPEDQGTAEDLSFGLAVSMANNFTNKTYLSGLANFFDMMQDPQRGFEKWSSTLGASFVPGQAAAIVAVTDPVLRDVRGIMDTARARWPGASDDLPPMRNVLGEPVKRAQSLGSDVDSIANAFVPILYREVSDDALAKEFAKLSHGFTPPKRVRGGIDLTTVVSASGQNAFDRWLELHGKVELGGRGNLRKALNRLISSPAYKKIPWQSTDELASPRIQMVQSVINDYRDRALRQMLKEFPELGAAERARVSRKTDLLRGNETRPALLQALRPQ